MLRRKRIKPDDRIPFTLSASERDLLLDVTLVDPEIERRLRVAATSGTQLVVDLTLEDSDDLAGSVAAEANHTPDAKKRLSLDRIFDRLTRMEHEYTDADVETTPTTSSSAPAKP